MIRKSNDPPTLINLPYSMYPFATQKDAEQFADMVAEALLRKQQHPVPKWITFQEAMQELGMSDDTLTRRIKANNIPTYRRGRGKAFDRNYLPYLK